MRNQSNTSKNLTAAPSIKLLYPAWHAIQQNNDSDVYSPQVCYVLTHLLIYMGAQEIFLLPSAHWLLTYMLGHMAGRRLFSALSSPSCTDRVHKSQIIMSAVIYILSNGQAGKNHVAQVVASFHISPLQFLNY